MTTESFCNMVWDLSYSKVLKSISKSDYKEFVIPKKNGVRKINYLPKTSMFFSVQKGLARYLEKQEYPTCVKGFRKGENYLSYLEPHVGAKCFLRVDIKDFFPSITVDIIKKELLNHLSFDSENDKKQILDLVSNIATLNDTVPQGAPCSPIISNFIMVRIDQRISKYCQTLGICYTRYADDLLFSSTGFNFKDKKWFLKKIKYILLSKQFKVNYSKIKYGDKEISLNGYVVSNDGIRLSRERIFDVRKTIAYSKKNYRMAKNNPEVFLQGANTIELRHRDLTLFPYKTIYQFVQFLCGYRAYLLSFLNYDITPLFAKKVVKLVNNIEEQIKKYQ